MIKDKKKVLVITGTYGFKELVKKIEKIYLKSAKIRELIEFKVQDYKKKQEIREGIKYINWIEDIEWINYDLIISHGGRGSIINSIEKKRCLIVVENKNVVDMHQSEIKEIIKGLFYINIEDSDEKWIKEIGEIITCEKEKKCKHRKGEIKQIKENYKRIKDDLEELLNN